MAIVDVRNVPTIVEVGPSSIVADFTEEQVVAQVMMGPTVVEFSWGELVPEPGLRGGGPFEGTVTIGPWIPGLPETTEAVDPVLDRIMVWDESMQMHVQRPAALGGGGSGGGVEFATREETDEGVLTTKAIHPDGGAYAYDRLRHVGQHAAGKGTETVFLVPVGNVVTVDMHLSNVFSLTLGDDYVMANPLNPINGQTVNILIRQTATGGKNITTWNSSWSFANKITPVCTPDPNAVDLVSGQWDSVSNKMRCSFIPNYGAGFSNPDPPTASDLTFTNVGGGNEIYRDTTGLDVNLRTIVSEGDISVTTNGDRIVIGYTTPPATTVEKLNDLIDVDSAGAEDGDGLEWSATSEAWIPVPKARKWTVGATWSNGANVLGTGVNKVNAIIAEDCVIEEWYIVTDGGNGSCVVDVRRVPLAEYPPLGTDTICGGEKPSLSSQTAANDPSLGAWDVNCTAGDVLQFVLESVSTFKMVQIVLVVRKVS